MIQLKGRIPSPIHIHGKIGKALPTFTVTFKDGNTVLPQTQVKQGKTATYNGTVPAKDGNEFLGWVLSEPSNDIVDTDTFGGTIYQQITNVTEDITCWAVYSDKRIIHDSWDVISQRSQAGTAGNYYHVGDMKKIHVQGNILEFSSPYVQYPFTIDKDFYVYILGINHNSALEGNGITFGCFKDAESFEDKSIIHFSSYNKKTTPDMFVMSAYPSWNNIGGWRESYMRYNVLGSTDTAPDGAGAGTNATSTCATNPVANTLLSCFPQDLRAVMKPIAKYTDNAGNNSNIESNVTVTTDYLPLLSEFEVFGERTYANEYEQSYQQQYEYFAIGNRSVKFNYESTNPVVWWLRSPKYNSDSSFNCVSYETEMGSYKGGDGFPSASKASVSLGLSPIFKV